MENLSELKLWLIAFVIAIIIFGVECICIWGFVQYNNKSNKKIPKTQVESNCVKRYSSFVIQTSKDSVIGKQCEIRLLTDSTFKVYYDKENLVIKGDTTEAILELIKQIIKDNEIQSKR